ncbi:MAG: hypothetical protein ABIU29_06230 [Chthoniobacterales bacterium]
MESSAPPARAMNTDDPKLDPDGMAEAYWHLASQPRTAWTLELDLRPATEKFFD